MGRDHQELGKAKLLEQTKPVFTLDHLVRERYPTFVHALRDIDDALCMVHLYAMLPVGTSRVRHRAGDRDGRAFLRARVCVDVSEGQIS